jgi:hypothetical protein
MQATYFFGAVLENLRVEASGDTSERLSSPCNFHNIRNEGP